MAVLAREELRVKWKCIMPLEKFIQASLKRMRRGMRTPAGNPCGPYFLLFQSRDSDIIAQLTKHNDQTHSWYEVFFPDEYYELPHENLYHTQNTDINELRNLLKEVYAYYEEKRND